MPSSHIKMADVPPEQTINNTTKIASRSRTLASICLHGFLDRENGWCAVERLGDRVWEEN